MRLTDESAVFSVLAIMVVLYISLVSLARAVCRSRRLMESGKIIWRLKC